MMHLMRTTIDMPDDLHEVVRQLAHDRRESMSKVAADLLRRGVQGTDPPELVEIRRGIPIISVGHPVTPADVASLEDD